MAYTNGPTFPVTTPLGSRNANEIDAAIRERSVDIKERLVTLIGADGGIDTDPIIPSTYNLTYLRAKLRPSATSGLDGSTDDTQVVLAPGRLTHKTLPIGADLVPIGDSAASNAAKYATRDEFLTKPLITAPQFTVVALGTLTTNTNIDLAAAAPGTVSVIGLAGKAALTTSTKPCASAAAL